MPHKLASRRIWALAVGLAVAAAPARASDHSVTWDARVYRVGDGLPSTLVYAVQQDTRGYLWLGTALGLVRFDGTEFVAWSGDGTTALPPGSVTALAAARDGSVWIGFGGAGGVSRLSNGRVVNYPARRTVAIEDSVSALLEDRQGVVWCGTIGGLTRFSSGGWEQLGASNGIPPAAVLSLYEDRRGTLWVGTTAGVFRRVPAAGAFELFSKDVVQAFAQDRAGTLWAAVGERVLKSMPVSSAERRRALPTPGMARRLLSDSYGNLWVGTTQGLLRVAGDPGAVNVESLSGHDGLEDEEVTALVQDGEGNIWVGSRGGLRRFFVADVIVLTNNHGLIGSSSGAVTSTSDGTVWVGTNDGISALSRSVARTMAIRHEMRGERVFGLYADPSGAVWVGRDGAVAKLADGRVSSLPVTSGTIRGLVRALRWDGEGNLWLCHARLSRWHDGIVSDVVDDSPTTRGLCTSLASDSAGRLWVGFVSGGIASYDGRQFRWYTEAAGVPPGPIATLYVGRDDVVWAGTFSGVSRLQDGRVVTIDEGRGLPGKKVTGIVEDDRGNVWLALSAGIMRLAKTEFDKVDTDPAYRIRYELYDSTDGLMDVPETGAQPSATRDGDGRLWFHTVRGVAIVDPSRQPPKPKGVSIRLDNVIVDGRTISPNAEPISIRSGARAIEFDYGAVSLSAASKVRFSYFLEGFDRAWIPAGVRRKAFYTNLPPGSYAFHVRAEVNGLHQAAVVTRLLTVLPAFYQQGWFFGVTACAALLAGWSLWQLRVRALRREFAATTAERARIGREVHDTILQSMAGVKLQVGAAQKKFRTSVEGGLDELRRIERRLEGYIYDARQSVLMLRSSEPEPSLPDALWEFVDDLARDGRPGIRLHVAGQPDEPCSDVERELLRIAQEAVRNALQHGRADAVRVELEYAPMFIRLRVVDDGCGFDVDERRADRRHWGLVGMEERARNLGARFTIVSRPGHGTDVDVTVPRTSAA